MGSNPRTVSSTDKLLAIASHLSGFLGFPFIIPLVIYFVKREESSYVADNASEALNFHLSILVHLLGLGFIGFILGSIRHEDGLWLPVSAGVIWLIVGAILSVIAAIKSADSIIFRYPLTIPFFGAPRYTRRQKLAS